MSALRLLFLFGCCALVAAAANEGTIVDRIAVIVDQHAIKTSEIDLDQRLTAFLNRETVTTTSADRRASAERLVDQEIIRQAILSGGFRRPMETQASAVEAQLMRDRFGGSEARLRQALEQYGLTREELRAQLLWQLTVLGFIDQRFRAGVSVSDEAVRAYYDQHTNELRRQYPEAATYEAVEPHVRSLLEAEDVDRNFNQWLAGARQRSRIEYVQEAFS